MKRLSYSQISPGLREWILSALLTQLNRTNAGGNRACLAFMPPDGRPRQYWTPQNSGPTAGAAYGRAYFYLTEYRPGGPRIWTIDYVEIPDDWK